MKVIPITCNCLNSVGKMTLGYFKKKTDKYTSGDMQNEMIKVMALQVLQEVASSIHLASFVTLMVDETTDASNLSKLYCVFIGLMLTLKSIKTSHLI